MADRSTVPLDRLRELAASMTVNEIASAVGQKPGTVRARLRNASITAAPDRPGPAPLPRPAKPPRPRKAAPPAKPPRAHPAQVWDDVERDYLAGDRPLTLDQRYGIAQQSIDRKLRERGVTVRSRAEATTLRSRQADDADAVRYRLRTGALDRAAADLGITPDTLRACLERHGLILPDFKP